jgi:hypothetical protein
LTAFINTCDQQMFVHYQYSPRSAMAKASVSSDTVKEYGSAES